MSVPDRNPLVTRVLLVDDHALTSLGARDFLDRQPDIDVVATAASSQEAFQALDEHDIDLAVVDLVLGSEDGLELMKQIASRHASVRMVVLTMHDERLYAERALRAGARGYVMKGESPDVLTQAVRTVRRGDIHLSDEARAAMADGTAPTKDPTEALSDRELTVYRWLGEGLSSREIAESLHLSTKTVHTYRERIKTKLGLHSASELVHHAIVFARPTPPPREREDEGQS